MKKICKICKKEYMQGKGQYKDICKVCYARSYNPKWYRKNIEKVKEKTKKWKKDNQEKVKEMRRRNYKDYQEKEAGRSKPNQCEACKEKRDITFDHNHKTGKFRGWLCKQCNFILGLADDSPKKLYALIDYLKKVV